MGKRVELLDHGYVEFIESWGSDERIIESARMSTSGGFVSWDPYQGHPSGDFGLLKHLHGHKHTTPFEMAGMVIEVQAPIMVFREWHRHRTQSYNEMSARYTPLPDVNYVPTTERLLTPGQSHNKQSGTIKGAEALDYDTVVAYQDRLDQMYVDQQMLYEWALQAGVPKELARVHLGVGRYSRMRASANLKNWLDFLTLRLAPEAQWEIRQYAAAVGGFISELFPRTWSLFTGSSHAPSQDHICPGSEV
jgi:thymidylate synthase (FAD)